jgi:hypothetical protein
MRDCAGWLADKSQIVKNVPCLYQVKQVLKAIERLEVEDGKEK